MIQRRRKIKSALVKLMKQEVEPMETPEHTKEGIKPGWGGEYYLGPSGAKAGREKKLGLLVA